MSKQGPAETCPQQLILDFSGPKPEITGGSKSQIIVFVDAATRMVRQQALERVKAAGIFQVIRDRQ
jgi:hypothetical protein